MAIVFHKNVRNNFINNVFQRALKNLTDSDLFAQTTPVLSMTIWGGVQPTAAQLNTNWTSTYKTTFLLHLRGFGIYQPSGGTPDVGITLQNSGLPTAATSYNAGTATWAVLWQADYLQTDVTGGSSMMTTSPRHVLLPVSNLSGSSPVRMVDTTILAATAYTISDISITAAGGIA